MVELEDLISKRLRYIGRACDVCWLGFGDLIFETDYKGNKRTSAEYALHIQSAFRLWNPYNKQIHIGYSDIFYPCGDGERPENFEWDIQGNNLYDEKVDNLQKNICIMNELVVAEVKVKEFCDLTILFANGYQIDTLTECFSGDAELWRFFKSGVNEPHLVATGTGLQRQ